MTFAAIFTHSVTAAEHLFAWFTPARRELINSTALDRLSGRPVGTMSRFLAREPHMTLERAGVHHYYPILAHLGYEPLPEFLVPKPKAPVRRRRRW